ncbi:hypothetical protein LSTR_LSTR006665 [Laodelphax striatellus]|uniref:Threonylcarbamoyl-AMP synthase n=1 Tax=Laodelphax striatellus TaxID=195883 RepID=A0A482X8T8_LAOST|nr:hypothetical protein LSTR_LSTR006665 [Laodelphax striatellus]
MCLNAFDDKIGIRVPDHPFAQLLANEFGRPLVLKSATLQREPNTVTLEELYPFWENLGAIYYDGGRLGSDRSGSICL